MARVKLIKLSGIRKKLELYRGSQIRLVNNGVAFHPDDKFFDYLLVSLPWERNYVVLVNITANSHKEGAAYAAKISIDKSTNKIVVGKAELKKALGPDFKLAYLINSR